ncbi:MAG: glutamine--tRNA ligase/YqeY domain fusion protein [Peptococcaceae bacterium]|jgi:glutaminyl-tRNA synthetase|nr:glutamine--tRNA ligase/YqeY domain fusion protein [Peptococcaceae bacterium]
MSGTIPNFIHEVIDSDLASGRETHVHTRFPPEPNGCLHIGSAKAIWINFTTAKKYGGKFNLRFDDTNPAKEDDSFVQSILEDIRWLIGEEPDGGVFFGSDYFDRCYEFALELIKNGHAYVCDLSPEEMRDYRGTLTAPGKDSPYRERTPAENLDLFVRMRDGEFPDGSRTLRAKIDMASPNIVLRDPALYRILRVPHHRQGDKWRIYPLYDYAHPIQDALEGITHSLCSLEFANNRPLYDWVVEKVGFARPPHQYEFARLNITHTVMSKRYLRQLVETGLVDGWDDPRLPTLAGLRRRGYTPAAIFNFLRQAGISKVYGITDIRMLEHCVREELNIAAPRRVAVLEPLKVTITNYPAGETESFFLPDFPGEPGAGGRELPFSRELYVERADFMENPPGKFFRLKPGGEVRLMGAYLIRCETVIKDAAGEVTELLCVADLETGNGMPADGRKVRGTIHWLSRAHARDSEIRLYDNLFTIEDVNSIPAERDYDDYINPASLRAMTGAKVEEALVGAAAGERFQFVRQGYFTADSRTPGVFNQTVALKDSKGQGS